MKMKGNLRSLIEKLSRSRLQRKLKMILKVITFLLMT